MRACGCCSCVFSLQFARWRCHRRAHRAVPLASHGVIIGYSEQYCCCCCCNNASAREFQQRNSRWSSGRQTNWATCLWQLRNTSRVRQCDNCHNYILHILGTWRKTTCLHPAPSITGHFWHCKHARPISCYCSRCHNKKYISHHHSHTVPLSSSLVHRFLSSWSDNPIRSFS